MLRPLRRVARFCGARFCGLIRSTLVFMLLKNITLIYVAGWSCDIWAQVRKIPSRLYTLYLAFDDKPKKEGPVGEGGGAGGWSSFAVTSEWGRGRGNLCHRKRPVDDGMTSSSGSSQRKTSGGGGGWKLWWLEITRANQCSPLHTMTWSSVHARCCCIERWGPTCVPPIVHCHVE